MIHSPVRVHTLSYYSPSSQSSPFSDPSDVDCDGFLQSRQRIGCPFFRDHCCHILSRSAQRSRRSGHSRDESIDDTVRSILNEDRVPGPIQGCLLYWTPFKGCKELDENRAWLGMALLPRYPGSESCESLETETSVRIY